MSKKTPLQTAIAAVISSVQDEDGYDDYSEDKHLTREELREKYENRERQARWDAERAAAKRSRA